MSDEKIETEEKPETKGARRPPVERLRDMRASLYRLAAELAQSETPREAEDMITGGAQMLGRAEAILLSMPPRPLPPAKETGAYQDSPGSYRAT